VSLESKFKSVTSEPVLTSSGRTEERLCACHAQFGGSDGPKFEDIGIRNALSR